MSFKRLEPRFHNPTEAMAALAEKMDTIANPRTRWEPACNLCRDSGWMQMVDETSHAGTVRRCVRGCEVPDRFRTRREPSAEPDGKGPVSIT